MFSSGSSQPGSEELLKIFEIQLGIAGLGDVILSQKRSEDVEKLQNIIEKLDARLLKIFQQDVKRPLIEIVCNFEEWLQSVVFRVIFCIQCLVKKGLVNSVEEVIIFYSRLFALIDAKTNERKGTCLISEDLKLKVLACLKNLLESLNAKQVSAILELKHLHPMIGHSVHVLLSNSINDYSTLALESTITLETVLKTFAQVPQVKIENQLLDTGDLFASFFPGISIGMMKVITKSDKVPQKVLIACLNTLKSLLSITLTQPSPKASYFQENLVTKRSQQWLATSTEKLEIVFDRILKAIVNHNLPSVRKNLVVICRDILILMTNLESVSPCKKLFKGIIILSVDQDLEVRLAAEKAIESFFSIDQASRLTRSHTVQDKFYQVLTSTPRKFQLMSEDSKIVRVKLIAGYIKCLKQGLHAFLLSESSKNRMFHCLLDLTTFKEKPLVVERLPVGIDSANIDESKIPLRLSCRRKFKHFESEDVEKHLEYCCSLIGQYLPSYSLIDHLLSLVNDGPTVPPVLFVINNSIKEIANVEALDEILAFYVAKLEQLTLEDEIDFRESLTIELLIEGLSVMSKIYGPSRKHEVLLAAIYPVLASTASDQSSIAEASLICLKNFAVSFDYSSIKHLIEDNIDYLLNYINSKLKHYERDMKCCAVMKAVLCFSDMNIFDYFEYTLNNVLSKLDVFYATDCENLVNILYVIASAIHEYCPKQETPTIKIQTIETRRCQAINDLKEYLESRRLCDTLDVDESKENEEMKEPEENDEVAVKLPNHIKFVKDILDRCCHLLSNPKQEIKMKAMDIAIKGLQILRLHEDELLPMAHKLWDPLLKRLHGNDLLILKKSFDCLNMMTICSGDFLRGRTVEYVMPKLCNFLRQQSFQSYGKTDTSPYKFTIEYKIQKEVLNQIGSFCYHLKINEKNLWSVVECLLPYLNNQQPLSLQEAARESLLTISYVDPYSVYYYLDTFLESKKEKEKNYIQNVQRILRAIS